MGSKHSVVLVLAAAMLTLVACASPIPQPTSSPNSSPSPSLAPSPPPTEQPTPTELSTPTRPPTIHVDGLATVAVDGLRRLLDAAHPEVHGGPNEDPGPLRLGEIAFLVDGPRRVASRDYWLLAVRSGPAPLGWAAATDESGASALLPFQPTCPPADGLSAAAIDALGGLQALACFGDRELTLTGVVECNRAIADGGVGGAPYFDSNRHCVVDGLLRVYGDTVTAILDLDPDPPTVRGTFELRGHMDDPGARGCGWIQVGVNLDSPTTPDPGSVVWCRQNFVVTAVAPAN